MLISLTHTRIHTHTLSLSSLLTVNALLAAKPVLLLLFLLILFLLFLLLLLLFLLLPPGARVT